MSKRWIFFYLFLGTLTLFPGCTTVVSIRDPKDPWEGFNREIFRLNEVCDKVLIRPVAETYDKKTPRFIRLSVSNFYSNLKGLSVALNKLLQGDMIAATESFMRFMINCTFGLGGLKDIATQLRLPDHQANFGSTLAHWGVPSGPYLMLPLLGPSTVRDSVGFIPEWFFGLPTSYIDSISIRSTLFGIFVIDTRANLLQASDLLSEVAFDKYIFLRDIYFQQLGSRTTSSRQKCQETCKPLEYGNEHNHSSGSYPSFSEDLDPYAYDDDVHFSN